MLFRQLYRMLVPRLTLSIGKDSPPAPDYAAAARAQGAANVQTAQQQALLNNPNIVSPYGSQTWSEGPQIGVDENGLPIYGRPSETIALSPAQQGLLNTSQGIQQGALNILQGDMPNIAQALGGQFNYNPQPALGWLPGTAPAVGMQYTPGNSGPIQASVQPGQNFLPEVERAQYQQAAAFLDPQFQQAQNQLNVQLANQGITAGSDAYNQAQNNFALQKMGAYQNAINNAITTGQQAAQGIFGMNLASGQFGNAAQQQQYQQLLDAMMGRNAAVGSQASIASNLAGLFNQGQQQGFNQYVAQRTLPINMLTALLGLGQVTPPTAQATQPTAIQTTPIMQGALAQGQQNAAQASANAGKFGSGLGAAGQIGAAAVPFLF